MTGNITADVIAVVTWLNETNRDILDQFYEYYVEDGYSIRKICRKTSLPAEFDAIDFPTQLDFMEQLPHF